jgi:hypothetical protein
LIYLPGITALPFDITGKQPATIGQVDWLVNMVCDRETNFLSRSIQNVVGLGCDSRGKRRANVRTIDAERRENEERDNLSHM